MPFPRTSRSRYGLALPAAPIPSLGAAAGIINGSYWEISERKASRLDSPFAAIEGG